MRKTTARFGLLLLPAVTACGGPGAADGNAVTRDSAGITIVESPASALDNATGIRIASAPALDVGGQADSIYQLFRVNGAARLPDGAVVIANAGSQQLRFYDAGGVYQRSTGRKGRGPGEFELPVLISSIEYDSLYVLDQFARTLSIISTRGDFVRSFPTAGRVFIAEGRLDDGHVLVSTSSARASLDTPEGIIRNRTSFELYHETAAENLPVAQIEGPTLFLSNRDGRISFTTVPFTIAPSAAPGRSIVALALADAPEIRIYDQTGALTRIIRISLPTQAVSRAEFDAAMEKAVTAADSREEAEIRRRYAAMPVPDVMPWFSDIIVDAGSNLWVRRYGPAAADAVWIVLDAEGNIRGRATMPAGLAVTQIGNDFVLGVWRDADGVEHVRSHALDASAFSGASRRPPE